MLVGVCFFLFGAMIAFVFVLLLINFDNKWKVLLESLVGLGGNTIILVSYYNLFEINDERTRYISAIFLYLGFFIGVGIELYGLCYLIKDKDDSDVLRIRDIILGQKSYIDKYYQQRTKEIDLGLNIPMLEERSRQLDRIESSLVEKRVFLEQEEKRVKLLGNKKVKMILPESAEITITSKFVDELPSYINDYIACITEINKITESFLGQDNYTTKDLKVYLLSIVMNLSTYLFSSSKDIRIHFRYFNLETQKYEKLISLTGKSIYQKNMTSIPYENSMIKKSFECKCALIKSINPEADYASNNNRLWKDYLTYAFSGFTKNDKPILSFGISVKNESRFRDIFYFLNYIGLENYLAEKIDAVNQYVNIAFLLYNEKEEPYE